MTSVLCWHVSLVFVCICTRKCEVVLMHCFHFLIVDCLYFNSLFSEGFFLNLYSNQFMRKRRSSAIGTKCSKFLLVFYVAKLSSLTFLTICSCENRRKKLTVPLPAVGLFMLHSNVS